MMRNEAFVIDGCFGGFAMILPEMLCALTCAYLN